MTARVEELELSRVRTALDLGRPQEALKLLSSMLASDPKNARLWTLLSEARHDANQFPEALKAAETAVGLDPQNHLALYYRALGHWNTHVLGRNVRFWRVREQAQAAQGMLREAIRLQPFQPGYHSTLAKLLLQTDDRDQAELHLRKALELAPENSFTLLGLAELALECKNAPEAQRLAEQVLAQEPESVDGMGILAWARLRQSDPHAALRTAFDAVRQAPADSVALAYFSALTHAYLPRPLARGSWVWRTAVVPQVGIAILPFMAVLLGVRNVWRYRQLPPDLRRAVGKIRPLKREQGALLIVLISVALIMVGALLGDQGLGAAMMGLASLLITSLFWFWVGWQVWKWVQSRRKQGRP